MSAQALPLLAALALALPAPAPTSPLPGLVLAAAGDGAVIADFGTAEYYPNLKSKFGIASNVKEEQILDAQPMLADLAPGLICSNLEFDFWFKWPGEIVPALALDYAEPGNTDSRPVAMSGTPGDWMTEYERLVSGLDASLLVQLTGAPPQFQVDSAQKPAIHPGPTDPEGAAALVAEWTAARNHVMPILWSLWNEPGHTLTGERKADKGAKPGKKDGKRADKKAAKQDAKAERRAARQGGSATTASNSDGTDGGTLSAAEGSASAGEIAGLYTTYNSAMRPVIGPWSRFGLSSFLSADFNAARGAGDSRTYFQEVMQGIAAETPVDYLTFNSFNGAWSVILNGTRAVLGTDASRGPIIFTQFAPASMKFNPDGSKTKEEKQQASATQAALDMVDDYVALTRATDVQHVCMSYWIGAAGAFLDGRKGGLRPTARYHAMKMVMQLPVLRTRLDFADSGLVEQGVQGLAGRNQAKAAVLLWNTGEDEAQVPLEVQNLPQAMAAGQARITLLDDDIPSPEAEAYDGGPVTLPAHSMALVEWRAEDRADPLLRRNALDGDQGEARFLQARSVPDRMAVDCGPGMALEGIDGCTGNTGTYGAYDSQRAAAWLGVGIGGGPARVRASYANLPERVFASVDFAAVGQALPAEALQITASFAGCEAKVTAAPAEVDPALLELDLSTVPADCRAGGATLRFSLADVPEGTQAEVYLSADEAEALALAEGAAGLVRPDAPDLAEGLKVVKPRQELND